MTIREGSWDCPSCGAVGQRGRDTSCRSCRRPRPGNVDFYLPRDAPAVDAGYQLEQANAGPDWTCDRCRRANRATEATCSGCSAARGDSAARSVH